MDKYHLYTSPIEDSSDYFYETHADALEDDFNGELYYDNEKNVTIIPEGKDWVLFCLKLNKL